MIKKTGGEKVRKFVKNFAVIMLQILIFAFASAVLGGVILYLMENTNYLLSALGYLALVIVVAALALIMYAERHMDNSGTHAIIEG